ncbi:circadian clock protein LdpA [Aerosakkonemataceae cyanobacterium BLCC-F154]|uniref:Circadian clock protein LdpA n=1 Tax=Floridaenema fluviatile BLCC-F154 TaxID=3153640 RepID=A0ABV4Y5A0_9CYAN
MTNNFSPLHSLREGRWFKLICGASFQHLPAVRNLSLVYTLAGADCIDVAADPAVIVAAKEALETALSFGEEAQRRGFGFKGLPLLMTSLNDGEDPHFRKAQFDVTECPTECPRPCESVCPADAIVFDRTNNNFSGVLDQLCYGCGRCIPICPSNLIFTRAYISTPEAVAPLVLQTSVDAVEIHTQVGRLADFQRLWSAIAPGVNKLKVVAISCPDGEGLINYLWALYDLMKPLPCELIWQTDGRPMSGDIGAGTTHAAIKLGKKVLAAGLPGYVQLAGGTNNHTVSKLKAVNLLNSQLGDYSAKISEKPNPQYFPKSQNQNYIAGIAYGSFARVMLSPILDRLEAAAAKTDSLSASLILPQQRVNLEDHPELLWQAVSLADSLVSQIKSPNREKVG